jgi:hypothetical protein
MQDSIQPSLQQLRQVQLSLQEQLDWQEHQEQQAQQVHQEQQVQVSWQVLQHQESELLSWQQVLHYHLSWQDQMLRKTGSLRSIKLSSQQRHRENPQQLNKQLQQLSNLNSQFQMQGRWKD